MDEYVTKEQIIDWFSPYGHLDKPIPFETLVSDLRGMEAADVEPVRHGHNIYPKSNRFECSLCGYEDWDTMTCTPEHHNFCPNCGARMDEEVTI